MENKKMKPKKKNSQKFKLIPLFILLLLVGIGVLGIGILDINTKQVQAADDPITEPLLQLGNLVYEGAFKVPKGDLGDDSTNYDRLGYGGGPIAFNQARNSLFVVGHPYGDRVAEISIPEIVNSNNLNDLKTASLIQPAIDITDNHWANLALDGSALSHPVPGGLLLFHNRLIGSAYVYYDASGQGYRSHFYASPNWSTEGTNFHGMYRVGVASGVNGGFVGGYMALIPPEWQSGFGGSALTGLGGIPIILRTSWGPCAWVFNPDDLGVTDPVPATMLVGYTSHHPTLGGWGSSEGTLYFNMATQVRGLVFPYGTRSVLFFGRHGLGETGQGDKCCYGIGTADQTLAQQDHYCYDPSDSSKGCHCYPYVYQVWAYDANDLLKVKNGEINPETNQPYQPWDIRPYAIWNLDFPFAKENAQIVGATYDPSTQRIFISEYGGERPSMEPYPLIQVYKVDTSSAPTSTPDTTPPTLSLGSPSGTLSADTTSTTLSITTNENATCRYSTTTGTSYDSMTNTFTTTGGTNHSTTITGLTNGGSYTYYIRCQDTSGNANTTDYPISFSIANPTPSTPTYTITNFISLITHWLSIGDQRSDVNNDGIVDARDLGIMMHYWK